MMFNTPLFTGDREEILQVIRHVRNRWRFRVAIRGIAVLMAAAFGTLLISSYGLEVFKFSSTAIVTFRIVTYLALLGFGWGCFIRPIARRVSDEHVALYLEEHEPSLQASVLSAVEESKKGERSASADHSPALVRRGIELAVDRVREIDMGCGVEHQRLQISSGLLLAAGVAGIVLFLFGPAYLRHGISALLTPMSSVEAASPYQIEVFPGDATVARGADQTVTARLIGFESDDVNLFMRANSSAPFDRLPLVPIENSDAFEALLFDLQKTTDYFVESVGVQSPTFTFEVTELPYVERLELEYHFPAYTGLETRLVKEGGDIAVLQGTEVRLRAVPTMGTAGGQLVFDEADDDRSVLTVDADGALTASFVVEEEGFYRVDLQAPDGQLVTASPQYTIDVLTDQPPSVMFLKPGRDTTASAIEEMFVEARADDDFGLRALALVYSVNGGPEHEVDLFDGRDNSLKEVSAGHTFFLEELELEPGDFLSYFARATDRNLAQQNKDVKSDLYFIQIRRFNRDFRASQSQAGMGGGVGDTGADPRALSEAQREIVAGTFNVIRDREDHTDEEYRENLVFLALAQGRLRDQVETLLRRMNSRIMPADPVFRSIGELLPQAADAMRAAEDELQRQDAESALPHEQRALQFLQRAEEAYEEVLVTMGGGGGGGRSPEAEDLADLFELELDKLRNQYETMQRGQQQRADNTVDELMERLRELARRQEREAEHQRRRARGQRSAQSGGGAGQRALAEETEETARRLQRLAREQNSPQMMDAARQLQEAADAMRRAAANDDNLGFAEAGAALDRLSEVEERLRGEQQGRLERDIQDAIRRANRLADEEREVASSIEGLGGLADGERMERLRGLMERKDAMEAEVADLERQLDSTSAEFRREERDASRQLQDAANSIRDNKLKEKIRYSKGLVRSRAPETAGAFEEEIRGDIEDLREKLSAAVEAVGNSQENTMTRALDETRDLMRGLESLEHRMKRQEPSNDAQQGQFRQADGQQAGQPGGADGQPGVGDTCGGVFDGGGGEYGDQRLGTTGFDPQDIRQWQREFRQRAAEAQDIRRLLREEDFEVGDLDEVIQRMRELDNMRVYQDAEAIARLQTFILEDLKRFEYRLRREVDEENEELFLAGNEEVPPGFRELIEEYYRSLSLEQ
jgi:hypothetical protein